ncbi:hypothetical protein [Litorimonas sp.]|uniref:hypothetical protein n=1 Tax=Litorimonas sp. TaxID=1892381 RepID=UPI003A85CFFF
MKNSRKPWLKYRNPDKPGRKYHIEDKKPRQLIWARLWLVLGFSVGAHRFYLWDYRAGGIWASIYCIFSILLTFSMQRFFSFLPDDVVETVSLLIYLVIAIPIGVYEWRRLPKRIRAANLGAFGQSIAKEPNCHGEIGKYSVLRPTVLLAIAASVIMIFTSVRDDLWRDVAAIIFFTGVLIFLIHLLIVSRRPEKESS